MAGSTRDAGTDGRTLLSGSGMDKTISQDHSGFTGHVFSTAQVDDGQSRADKKRPPLPKASSHRSSLMQGESSRRSGYEAPDLVERLTEQLANKLKATAIEQSPSDPATSRVVDNLISTISRLQVENEMLKEALQDTNTVRPRSDEDGDQANDAIHSAGNEAVQESTGPRFVTIHAVFCEHEKETAHYLDPPRMFKGDTRDDHVRGTMTVDEPNKYLETHPDVAFAVVKTYRCGNSPVGSILGKVHVGLAVNAALMEILGAFPGHFPGFQEDPEDPSSEAWDMNEVRFIEHLEPYFLFYRHGKALMNCLDIGGLDSDKRESLRFLCQWMEDTHREEWDEADALFAQSKFNRKHRNKLFLPGDYAIWPDYRGSGRLRASTIVPFPGNVVQSSDMSTRVNFSWWNFNGDLSNSNTVHEVVNLFKDMHMTSRNQDDSAVDITSLESYPLRFAPADTKAKLIARGQKVWECRRRKLVCYHEPGTDVVFQAEKRYMIDYSMYKRLHPNNKIFISNGVRYNEILESEEPPEAVLACLPAIIHGFDFATKTWRALDADRITDVTWNKSAFSQLVASPDTKELIQAVVSAHGERKNMGLDIIEGKGQGLLILLHGGPGTGKTLTAESIAEEQEKPLYRVTCGDIGKEPAEVERYLGDVLEIGKTWGCVVLLDEADVFLEERSFSDQKRNAIISIFLRILEYYDGILILTTNRVGSFDEAFKSRIQLALGYPTLDEEDRYKIWENFVKMLPRTGERIDMQDLQMNLGKLAQFEINGRQIRNIITMARHLAKFRREMLRYRHMQDAVRSVQKFNEYLNQVKGVSDDDWARADKLR
ncbi:P-loop containing nucleoside triphosphate hydrolase [Fusarium albosuccineum]|uniref:P-loop containing nucleoside triphosphate hydrolase n=1 Tax=Fusarium albosuccineum TaxID=1237068 RepID=A0A8H4L060_9HYPO|nr:P-loop containing nucleoside triphosphate hydrolase [Fusarium albosuccineum]